MEHFYHYITYQARDWSPIISGVIGDDMASLNRVFTFYPYLYALHLVVIIIRGLLAFYVSDAFLDDDTITQPI